MRHYPDTCAIMGGTTDYPLVSCTFSMMDAVKTEALYGAASQLSKGLLYIPLYVEVPEPDVPLENYVVTILSPYHPLINQPMTIETVRWMRLHQTLLLNIPGVAGAAPEEF